MFSRFDPIPVCDRRTDVQTDGQTSCDSIIAVGLCIARQKRDLQLLLAAAIGPIIPRLCSWSANLRQGVFPQTKVIRDSNPYFWINRDSDPDFCGIAAKCCGLIILSASVILPSVVNIAR